MATLDFSELKRTGTVVLFQNEPWEILETNFMRTAQRKPVIQARLRNLVTGKVIDYNFKFGEKVEAADMGKRKAQYLYSDRDGSHFMAQDTFETITVLQATMGDKVPYLKEGTEVTILTFNGQPISVQLPVKVDLKVTQAPPGIKGDTATGGTKPVTVETGLVVQAPLFIREGDIIRVDTRDGSYVERANT
jgi:elongation factor P